MQIKYITILPTDAKNNPTTLSFAFKLQQYIQIYVFAMFLVYTQN